MEKALIMYNNNLFMDQQMRVTEILTELLVFILALRFYVKIIDYAGIVNSQKVHISLFAVLHKVHCNKAGIKTYYSNYSNVRLSSSLLRLERFF